MARPLHCDRVAGILVVVIGAGGAAEARAAGLFVSSYGTKSVHLLDTDSGAVLRTYTHPPMVEPTGLALSRDGTTLYVANTTDTDVVCFDARTGAFLRSYGDQPTLSSGLALSNDERTLYVGSFGGLEFNDRIYALDTATGLSRSAIFTGGAPSDLQLTRDGSAIYAALSSANTNSVVRVLTSGDLARRTYTFPPSSAPFGVALSPDESVLYAALRNDGASNTNMVAVVNTVSGARSRTFTVNGPLGDLAGLDISPDGSTLFVSDALNNRLYKVDTATGVSSPLTTPALFDRAMYVLYTDDPTVVPEPATVSTVLPLAGSLALRRRRLHSERNRG